MGIPQITRVEIDRLATEWCKAKHVVVMLDEVSKQFTLDVSNLVLRDFVQSMADQVAAKKAAATGTPAPTPVKKSSLVLTDL